MSRRIADLLIKIGADSYEFQQKAKSVEKSLSSMEKRLSSLGKSLSLKLTVKNYLTLGDISSKVGDRVGYVIIGHRKNRNLSYRTLCVLYYSRTLIKRGKV